jgi:hypothetical protein
MEIIYLNFDKILSKIALKKELKEKEKEIASKSVWQRAYECLTMCVNLLADRLQKFLRINISTRRKGNINASTHRKEDISPSRNGITIFVTLVPSCRIRIKFHA